MLNAGFEWLFLLIHLPMFVVTISEQVMLVLVKAMKNPRSALCKTSIMAASDIFMVYCDKLLDPTSSGVFDQLVTI